MEYKALLLLLTMLLVALAPEVEGVTVSANLNGEVFTSTTFASGMNGFVDQNIILDPLGKGLATLSSGTGPFLNYKTISNAEGDYANIFAFVDGEAAAWSYDYQLTPGTTSVKASETLTASNAGHIRCYATAKNKEGDYSNAQTMLFSTPTSPVSINGYSNYAQASKTQAITSQAMTSATAPQIQIDNQAYNKEMDNVMAATQITNGKLNGYAATATAALGYADVKVTNLKASVTNGNLYHNMQALNTWTEGTATYRSDARSSLTIPRNEGINPHPPGTGSILAYPYSASSYPSAARATKTAVSTSQSCSATGSWEVWSGAGSSKWGYGTNGGFGFSGAGKKAGTKASVSKTTLPTETHVILT